jgi:hypothetical protein
MTIIQDAILDSEDRIGSAIFTRIVHFSRQKTKDKRQASNDETGIHTDRERMATNEQRRGQFDASASMKNLVCLGERRAILRQG